MKPNNVGEILKGFFWGLGFSIAVSLCSTAYVLSALPVVEQASKDIAGTRAKASVTDIVKLYQVQILDIYKSDRQLKVTASVGNLTDQEVFARAIKVDLFDDSGRFVSSCTSDSGDLVIPPGEVMYHEVNCNAFPEQITKVVSAKGRLKLI